MIDEATNGEAGARNAEIGQDGAQPDHRADAASAAAPSADNGADPDADATDRPATAMEH